MSTNTNTEVVVIVKSATEVSAAYATYKDASAVAENSFIGVGEAALKVAQRQGYKGKQVGEMLRLSIYQQEGVLELEDTDPKKVAVADSIKFNLSMWATLVEPKSPEAAAQRDLAFAHNAKLGEVGKGKGKGRVNLRIGQKSIMDICRGNTTFQSVMDIKNGVTPKPADAPKPTPKPADSASTDDNTDTPDSPEAAVAQPSVPVPTADKPVANPEDAMRSAVKTLTTAYLNNLKLDKAVVAKILRDQADAVLA